MNKWSFKTSAILFLTILFISGCGNGEKTSKNTIQTMPLSAEQKKIVDLLDYDKNEIQIFSYETDEEYAQIDIWTEVYENGELADDSMAMAAMLPMENTTLSGEVAIIITKNPDFQWTFIIKNNGSKISATSEPCQLYKNGYAYGPMKEPVEIEDGKEIVLYTALFSNEDGLTRSIGDEQDIITNPEILKEYSYAHVIKCKFMK